VKQQIFEIRKAGFTNKGAAMMLIAAARGLKAHYPDAIVSVPVDHTHPYEQRAALKLWHRAELVRRGVDLGRAVALVPQKLRRRYGFVTTGEIDVIVDVAGLAYSDQWGPSATKDLARRATVWKQAGKKLILLPQAFGPFSSPEIRAAIKTVADHADLMFARDPVSLTYLTEVVGERDHIRLAPDFTNLLVGEPTSIALPGPSPVAIVPNARMLDKTDQTAAAMYPQFLQVCVEILEAGGHTPFFLVHEGAADFAIAQKVASAVENPIEILCPDDALQAKTLLGGCTGVIGSRYHALISALSQGVPAIGTGWSHKYQALFEDYGEPRALIPVSAHHQDIAVKLELITNKEKRKSYADRLRSSAPHIKSQAQKMWQSLFNTIEM
jgi:colanic acid/amylovoran biosynthesis protein